MTKSEHLDILRRDVEVWNRWREEHRSIVVNLQGTNLSKGSLQGVNLSEADLRWVCFREAHLSEADLSEANLRGANLSEADLRWANLQWADLSKADLSKTSLRGADLRWANLNKADLRETDLSQANLNKADLRGAYLNGAHLIGSNLQGAEFQGVNLQGANLCWADLRDTNLRGANLSEAHLSGADLREANLRGTNLSQANLSGADLSGASLISANLTNVNLTGCSIYGISAWDVNLEGAVQKDLLITEGGEPKITVDHLEVAQFIYLLLNNAKIRDVIDTIAKKVVLILGRFTDERKPVLHALRDELRRQNYSPVVFDFEKPSSRNFTETISTLAHLSRFIIADLTDAKSIPQELERIVPRLRVPVQSLLHISENDAYAMYQDFGDYHWVLPIYRYSDQDTLLLSLREEIIGPAEQKAQELEWRK